MTRDQILAFITEIGVVPVVRTSSAEGAIKAIDAIYRGEKQPPSALRPDIDRELEAIVLKAMHPKMEGRYEGAREFFEAYFTPFQLANTDGTLDGLVTEG